MDDSLYYFAIVEMDKNNAKFSIEGDGSCAQIYTLSIETQNSAHCRNSLEFSVKNDKRTKNDEIYIIHLYKDHKICIFKPLIPLKLAQFCWFGAGSFIVAFITVLLKQRGVSLSQFSWMNTIGPIIQIIGTVLTGTFADKLGRSKPVLITNILIVIAMTVFLILMPSMILLPCSSQTISVICSDTNYNQVIKLEHCNLKLQECYMNCSKAASQNCDSTDLACWKVLKKDGSLILSSLNERNIDSLFNNSCYDDLKSMLRKTVINSTCSNVESSFCQISCIMISNDNCDKGSNKNFLLAGYIITYVLFLTAFSNVFRCFDVIAMSLVKEYDKSFGHERFFAISGNMFISPIAGLIVKATTKENGEKNYTASLYFFIGLLILVLFFLYNLKVCDCPPSRRMLKQTLYLLKNIDVLSLAVVVLLLGTAWNFTKIYLFWFLEELNASSLIIGLIPSFSALYGLPFLLSSNWWIKKINSPNLIIIAFICYSLKTTGYSFIINPWTSLILEAFGGFTYYLLWVAVVQHSHALAPEGMRATVVAVAGALHFSFGKTTASLIGGFIMNGYGGREAFRVIAVICLVSAMLYSIYLQLRSSNISRTFHLNSLDKNSSNEKDSAHDSATK